MDTIPVTPIFIGGCPRSGTTMLGTMLGAAPGVITVPEATFKWSLFADLDANHHIRRQRLADVLAHHWQFPAWHAASVLRDLPDPVGLGAALNQMAQAYGRSQDRSGTTWVDHTPGNIRWADTLFSVFPDARLVHLIRDGRAATSSVLPLEWGPSSVPDAAAWWATAIAQGMAAERRFPDRVVTVRYEDLVTQPEATLQSLCADLGLTFAPEMATGGDYAPPGWTHSMHQLVGQGPDSSRVSGWRTKLSTRDVEVFEALTQELLAYLGYALDHGSTARPPTRQERLSGGLRGLARLGADKARRIRLERRGFSDAGAGAPR